MIPRTHPSAVGANGRTAMVVSFITNIAGLTRWVDYIPVNFKGVASSFVGNSYDNNGGVYLSVLNSVAGKQAWVDYIPIYYDSAATDAWQSSATGFIPVDPSNIFDSSDLTNGTLVLNFVDTAPITLSMDMTTKTYGLWANDTSLSTGLVGYYQVKG